MPVSFLESDLDDLISSHDLREAKRDLNATGKHGI